MPEFVNEIEKCFLHLEYIGFFEQTSHQSLYHKVWFFCFSAFFVFQFSVYLSDVTCIHNTLPPSFATTATTVFFL